MAGFTGYQVTERLSGIKKAPNEYITERPHTLSTVYRNLKNQ
jgi:hypothetical protein